eukprot:SAG31_NODE_21216_length_555_cov_0.675439_1_plen_26_part_01
MSVHAQPNANMSFVGDMNLDAKTVSI